MNIESREACRPGAAAQNIDFKSGNDLAALAARQIDYHLMGFYPITPSTEIAEGIDKYYAEGLVQTKLVPAEGEHSAAGICYGASTAGGRVLNATSAQGLLYALEQLPAQAGTRYPMVMNIVTRAINGPLNIRGDHSDLMFMLDTGWIILLARNQQAVYDMNIMAPRIGEHEQVRLPVAVAYDGFFTSHQKKRIEYFVSDTDVRNFVGPVRQVNTSLDPERPITIGPYMNDPDLINSKYQMHLAMEAAREVIDQVFDEFEEMSGRRYRPVDTYRSEDAEAALLALNSAAEIAKDAADGLRREGYKVGVVSPNILRPFPVEGLQQSLGQLKSLLVAERADSYGSNGGNVTHEVKAALHDIGGNTTKVISRVYGLGGRDFYTDDADQMLRMALRAGGVEVPWPSGPEEEQKREVTGTGVFTEPGRPGVFEEEEKLAHAEPSEQPHEEQKGTGKHEEPGGDKGEEPGQAADGGQPDDSTGQAADGGQPVTHQAGASFNGIAAFDYYGATPGQRDLDLGPFQPPIAPELTRQGLIKIEQDPDTGRLNVRTSSVRNMTALPKRIAPGHSACPGCGIFPNLNQFFKGIEGHVVVLFQTGCGMVVTTGYPQSSHRVTYIHNLFQNGGATLSGVVEMYHERKRRGELPADLKLTFVMVTGDGGMDIGMGSALGAALRDHGMIIVEYDNEGYMNTGFQLSYSTPLATNTTTSGVGPVEKGKSFQHKDMPQIMAASNIQYVATSVEGLSTDMVKKAAKAQWYADRGHLAYVKLLSTCTMYWRSDEKMGTEVMRAAVDCNFFPIYEVEQGKTKINYDPEQRGRKIPLSGWLEMMPARRNLLQPEFKDRYEALESEIERRWQRLKARAASEIL